MKWALACAVFLSSSVCAAQADERPSVETLIERVHARSTELREGGMAGPDNWWQASEEALEGLDLAAFSLEELSRLAGGQALLGPVAERAALVVEPHAQEPTLDGAFAAAILLELESARTWPLPFEAEDWARAQDAARQLIRHEGMADLLASDHARYALGWLPRVASGGSLSTEAEALVALAPALVQEQPTLDQGWAAYGFWDVLAESVPIEELQESRLALLGTIERAVEGADPGNPSSQRLRDTALYLTGNFARGELIDYPVPELTIEWSSDPAIGSMDDLKGKVVLLDFWATWCGPCLEAFPKLANLTDHYDGFDVVVLGVTNRQGAFYPGGFEEPPMLESTAEEQHARMPDYMELMGVTWPIVFTQQDVFNPDFGIGGIPYLAVLDPAGVVRFANVDHRSSSAELASLIDGLLTEFGLETPPPVAAEEE